MARLYRKRTPAYHQHMREIRREMAEAHRNKASAIRRLRIYSKARERRYNVTEQRLDRLFPAEDPTPETEARVQAHVMDTFRRRRESADNGGMPKVGSDSDVQ